DYYCSSYTDSITFG
nr:immunoglobulin light chain junction region [Macaca mulatta]